MNLYILCDDFLWYSIMGNKHSYYLKALMVIYLVWKKKEFMHGEQTGSEHHECQQQTDDVTTEACRVHGVRPWVLQQCR